VHVTASLHSQALQDQPQQQQDPPHLEQFNQQPLASSSSLQAPTGPLQADTSTASTSHPTETTSRMTAAPATSQPQHQYSPPAERSASQGLTDAAGSMGMAGAMSVAETRASEHSQAMAPGIDALRKRRAAAVLQQQQQQSPGEGTPPLTPQQAPSTTHQAEESWRPPAEHDAQAEATMVNDQLQTLAQTAGRMDTESDDITWADAADDGHGGVSTSREERQLTGDITSADQADYDNMLDAIASGCLDDWKPPAPQSSSNPASEQQLSSHHHTQLPSQEPNLESSKLQQQTWPKQAEAMPSTPAAKPLPYPTSAAAAPPDQQSVMPSHPTANPGSTHQQLTTEFSQQPAKPQSSQGSANSEQSQQSAQAWSSPESANSEQSGQPTEAAQQAWPWEDGKAAGTPTLSAAVMARSGRRLRLRTASSSGRRPQKQSNRNAASRSQTPSNLRSPKGTASQGTMQETEWRVIDSQQTTAEEFVKLPADIVNQRPVWAASAAVSAARAGAGEEVPQHERGSKRGPAPSESRTLTKQELRDLAARQGLDYERLLADALSRGIPVSD